jgi:hypothetical protein
VSEVFPEVEDRGGDGGMEGAVGGPTGSGPALQGDPDVDDVGGMGSAPGTALDDEGGTGADDGGPGSQNM